MENLNFVDYYEILELSAKANAGTVERVFRHLATRYHPDNRETGNRAIFDLVIEAHNVASRSGKAGRVRRAVQGSF